MYVKIVGSDICFNIKDMTDYKRKLYSYILFFKFQTNLLINSYSFVWYNIKIYTIRVYLLPLAKCECFHLAYISFKSTKMAALSTK